MRGWIKPPSVCPKCGNRHLWKNRTYQRTIHTLKGPRTVPVTQWRCRCGATCTDRVQGVQPHAKYADDIQAECVRQYIEREQDLEGTRGEMQRGWNISPSASTIWRAIQRAARGLIIPCPPWLSGILIPDEKWIKIAGRSRPVLLVVDAVTGVVLLVAVLPDRSTDAILPYLQRLHETQGFHTMVSDDWKVYGEIAGLLRVRHQLCQFHLLRTLNKRLRKYLGRQHWHMDKEYRQQEMQRIRQLFHWFLNSHSPERVQAKLRLIARLKKEHPKLARFINEVLRNWRKYFTYLEVKDCPRTSNLIERTIRGHSGHLKRIHGFRTETSAHGVLALRALYGNFRPYETGPYMGVCPYDISGKNTRGVDWMAYTGFRG